MALTPGTRIGSYEITAQIGVGGMGEVYRATDTKLKRQVAIKVLPEALAGDQDRLARFQREAEVLASLNHPNIAAIHGLEDADGSKALVMELVEGPTLADRMAQGPIPIDEALAVAKQIAEALEAAHEQAIIHRDLKPANVKVRPDGTVKVLDFGLAKVFEPARDSPNVTHSPTLSMAATQAGIILGTAGYMSPEQTRGETADRRADVWAFGVVLFEMLTGARAFEGRTASDVMAAVLAKDIPWVRLPARLHPRLRSMLERCLEKESQDRYGSIADARVDINAVLSDPAGPLGRAIEPAVQSQPPSKLLWVATVVVGVLAASAAWYLKPAERPGVVRFDHELGGTQQFANVVRPALAVSPDGRRFVYNTTEGLFLRSVDALEARPIPGVTQVVSTLMFSPDGEWVGYFSLADGQLGKIPVSGGAPVVIATVAETPVGASWTKDDRIVFAMGQAIMAVPASGGTPEMLFDVDTEEGFPLLPEMLPDGNGVLLTLAGTDTNVVAVHSFETGTRRVLFPGAWARYVPTGHLVYGIGTSLFAQPFDLATQTTSGGPVAVVANVVATGSQYGFPQYSLSSSGSLAYVRSNASQVPNRVLGIVDRNGGVEILPIPPGLYSSPRVSPDGSRIAVQTTDGAPVGAATGAVWIYDRSGGTALRQLTQDGLHPIWTPDGERVTFASSRDGSVSIYWQPADGSGVAERLTTAAVGTRLWPDSWSPDGRTLSYQVSAAEPGDYDLWTVSLDDPDNPAPLIQGAQRQHGSVFSPSGRWLAYSSNEGLPAEQVFVEPFPPTGVKYQVTRESGTFPVWAPDGEALFYRRTATDVSGESGPGFFEVEIVREDGFSWRNERRLPIKGFLVFGGMRDYDPMPDGERFVMVFPMEEQDVIAAPRRRIEVVLNWFEELRERVPVD